MRYPVVAHTDLYINGSFDVAADVPVPRFEPGTSALEYLRREGYVVIKGCANASEVEHARELFWAFSEGTGRGVRREQPETWIRNEPNPYGIFWQFGVGQSRLAWFVRSRPRLVEMFSHFWGTSDLISSFEGFSMFPPEEVEASWRIGEAWFHTDQNAASRPGLQTIQSLTSLWDQDETTGGPMLTRATRGQTIPSSHPCILTFTSTRRVRRGATQLAAAPKGD